MQRPAKKDCISIIGCGWYGLELGKRLLSLGYNVKGSTTSPEKLENLAFAGVTPYLLNFQSSQTFKNPDFFETNILVICIPPKRDLQELSKYVNKIRDIVALAEFHKIKKVLFISSTSVYGECQTEVDELCTPVPDTTTGQQLLLAEELLSTNPSFSTCILRFSGLVGPNRHPGRFFAGKQGIPNGQAPINLIDLEDCIGITLRILQQEAFGYIYNASGPHHPAKQVFYTAAAESLNLPAPHFIDELKNWKIITSVQVPERLNYNYKTINWLDWLHHSHE